VPVPSDRSRGVAAGPTARRPLRPRHRGRSHPDGEDPGCRRPTRRRQPTPVRRQQRRERSSDALIIPDVELQPPGDLSREFAAHTVIHGRSDLWTTSAKCLARPEGLEPPTPRFVVWCSIQLSYGRKQAAGCSGTSAAYQPPKATHDVIIEALGVSMIALAGHRGRSRRSVRIISCSRRRSNPTATALRRVQTGSCGDGLTAARKDGSGKLDPGPGGRKPRTGGAMGDRLLAALPVRTRRNAVAA
jgi:hypothetical protein